jgi:hypothetical protein
VPDRRGSRFALEVLFLLGLAAGLAFAKLPALEIAGIMVVGWLVVAALEWAAWRGEPHYGSGLPPRYYVPGLNLPPPQPLEQVATGYPEAVRDEAPTWIASAALRQEMLGEWPVAIPAADGDREPAQERFPVRDPIVDPFVDPWLVAELPVAPLDELPSPVEAAPSPADLEPEPELDPDPEPELDPDPEPEPELLPAAAAVLPATPTREAIVLGYRGVARHSLDPLTDEPARRRFGRRAKGEAAPTIDVPARPSGVRPLPSRPA